MRLDEASSFIDFGKRSPLSGLLIYNSPNNHVLHTVLRRTSVACFGDSPLCIRIPAAIATILCIPALYLFVWRWFDATTALVAVAIFSGATYTLDLATNARGYPLLNLAFLLSLANSSGRRSRSDWKYGRIHHHRRDRGLGSPRHDLPVRDHDVMAGDSLPAASKSSLRSRLAASVCDCSLYRYRRRPAVCPSRCCQPNAIDCRNPRSQRRGRPSDSQSSRQGTDYAGRSRLTNDRGSDWQLAA